MALKFPVKGGGSGAFLISICSLNKDGEKLFVFQAAPEIAPVGETRNQVSETSLAQKQKLDCALQLARTVSLDFNNALTGVLAHTSLLLGKAEPGHPWRHSLREVEKSAERAAEISNELAAFSQQATESPRVAQENLNAVVNRCVGLFRNARGPAITWQLQLEKNLFAARFSEAKLQQALLKVLENAVEAVSGGGGQIMAQTRNVELTEPAQDRNVQLVAGAYVCVEIADNGAGIEPEVLPRVFEPFFTTKGGAHRGLGLALAYGIVSNHGGGVAVSGQPGAGAGDNLHGTETVLVVDDEPLMLTLMETILTEYGYKILTASSGQKALEILARDDTKVELVVTDLVMPGMSGRELAEHIRQRKLAAKILCMSGHVTPSDKPVNGACLRKPFTSADLLAKVRRTINANLGVDE